MVMRAVEIAQPGGPEVMKPAERPKPSPKSGEILIKVAAAGVNRPDVLQRMGMYPVPPGASDLPGLEVAGEVVEGSSTRFKTGDKVCAGRGRRLRRVLHRTRRAGAAGAEGADAGAGGIAAGNLLHRLGERLRPRASRAR